MALPALRQPRSTSKMDADHEEYVILTLRSNVKLVVSSDGYHGVVRGEGVYLCLLCGTEIALDDKCKAQHKSSGTHLKMLETNPHLDSYSENLIRQLNKNICYCTICNLIVPTNSLMIHIQAEHHKQELEKASIRSSVYKPK